MGDKNRKIDIVDYVFLSIIKSEFHIEVDPNEVEAAVACIYTFDSVDEMLQKTRFDMDNPEIDAEYLLANRICRWIGGKLMYFSRLEWDERRAQ